MNEQERQDALDELLKDRELGKMAVISAGQSSTLTNSASFDNLSGSEQSWETTMSQFFKRSGKPAGSTWRRLRRRGLALGLYQPGKRHEGVDWMVCACDVSSSMDTDALRKLWDAMRNIREEMGVSRMTILPFNTGVLRGRIVEVYEGEDFPDGLDVGGGTSFAPVFDWVRSQDEMPDGIIVFTDMGSRTYGDEVDDVPTLWASSVPLWESKGYGSDVVYTNKAPFGEHLEIV
jgi:predicted metal-dependent peptidase